MRLILQISMSAQYKTTKWFKIIVFVVIRTKGIHVISLYKNNSC